MLMQDPIPPSSYPFGKFKDNATELDRLQRQAAIGLAIERQFWSEVGLDSGLDVLDAACGPGLITCELAKIVHPGKVVGIDCNPLLLSVASHFQRTSQIDNLDFRQANVYSLSEDIGKFDWAYARFLFQHLEKPLQALKSFRKVLKPNGRVCIVDVDDQWLTFYPEPSAFSKFITKAGSCQKRAGGDRNIGRKLYSLLSDAGYQEIQVTAKMITSQQLGMRQFVDIITGFKKQMVLLSEESAPDESMTNINTSMEAEADWGAVAIFCATARSPG